MALFNGRLLMENYRKPAICKHLTRATGASAKSMFPHLSNCYAIQFSGYNAMSFSAAVVYHFMGYRLILLRVLTGTRSTVANLSPSLTLLMLCAMHLTIR